MIADLLNFYLPHAYQVSDWWEDYVYLANRAPLMANSNYYGMDILTTPFPKPTQAARAGLITYLLMQVRREIDCETVSY
ncbi:unnamed protein product [Protopolystoma xenopodis]|uniref:Choline/carnitine acyltransferase domain-containing protein n=1 Tax=Protopolystoma xenopodis TaxID=117903 RepID=A0A3S5AYQ8_9PLAT|nr:unnamed protein product [Protopolystoma xenopodis]